MASVGGTVVVKLEDLSDEAVSRLVSDAICNAIRQERERCAQHALDAAANARLFGTEATAIICDAIASRIRSGE